jgi:HEAT repeats
MRRDDMSSRSDVEGGPQQLKDEDLLDTAERGKQVHERKAALKELLRRRSPLVRPMLGRLVTDSAAPAELRTTAAVALGREATAANEDALRRALAAEDPAVVSAAAEGLARIGGRAAYDALRKRTEPRPGPTRGLAFARTLIAYRMGLGTERLAEPPTESLLELDRARAVSLPLREVGEQDFAAARPWLERELPAIPVAQKGSVRFTCGNEHLWLVLAEGIIGSGGSAAAERDRVAAAVLKESECPDGWFVHEYILTHPRPGQGAALFGLRSSGKLVHFGEIGAGANAAVQVRAVDAPGVAGLELRAELGADGALAIREALCGPPRDERKRRPSAPAASQPGQALG